MLRAVRQRRRGLRISYCLLSTAYCLLIMKWSDMTRGVWVADCPLRDIAENTPLENPGLYKAAMQIFLTSGSQILRATTVEGVKLCRQIIPEGGQVWAVVGPSSKILAIQETNEAELTDHCKQQVAQLASGSPDAILIQSITDLEEAIILLRAARCACKLKVGVSMVYGSGAEQTDTIIGQACEDVTRRLVDAGADLIGCNCGIAVDEMVLVVRLMREITELPIIACPDAGQKELEGDGIVYRETPEDFASKALSLANAGANVIGGCCGITADHIKCLAQALQQDRAS